MAQEITPAGSFYPAYPGPPEGKGGWGEAAKQLSFVVFKWQRLILNLVLVFTVAAGVAMFLKPPVRTATAKVVLKSDRVAMQISGFALSGKTPYSPQIMRSEVEIFRSRQLLLPVAKKLLSQNGKPEKNIGPDELEAMMSTLTGNTVPVAIADSNIIQVTYFARTSEQAEKTLGLIMDEYIEQQATIQSGATKLVQFYDQEKERVQAELQEAEEELKNWQERNKTISIDEQISGQLKVVVERESALQQTEAQVEATRAKIATLGSQLRQLPERELMNQTQVNPAATKLKSDLVTAEVALQDLLQRFTEKHRTVQEKREQIAFLKKELAAAEKERIIGSETVALNPLRTNVAQQLADAQALLTSVASQKETLGKQIRESTAALEALREKKVEISRLSRTVDLHKDSFLLYGKKLEEARIAAGLGKEQLANIAVIEEAHATPGTDLPRRFTMVILAAFVGLALGLTIAFGFQFFNESIRTQDDIEYYLELPMLAAIPDLRDRPVALGGESERSS